MPALIRQHPLFLSLLAGAVLWSGCNKDTPAPQTPAESFDRAVTAFQESRLTEARTFFLVAESLSAVQGRSELQLQASVYLLRIAHERGAVEDAIMQTSRGLVLARSLGDFRAESELRLLEGRSLLDAGLKRQSQASLEDALRIASTFQEKLKVVDSELALGELWLTTDDVSNASEYFSRALLGAQEANETVRSARALDGLAQVFLKDGKPDEAANSIGQAVSFVDRSDEPLLAAQLRVTQGRIFERRANPNAALGAYREAVNILRRARMGRRYEAVILFRIGSLYATNHRGGDARKYFGDALEVARREGDRIAQYYLNAHVLAADVRLMTPEQRINMAPRIVQAYRQLATQFSNILQPTGQSSAGAAVGATIGNRDRSGAFRSLSEAASSAQNEFIQYLDRTLHQPYVEALSERMGERTAGAAYAGLLAREQQPLAAAEAMERVRYERTASDLDGAMLPLRHPATKSIVERLRRDALGLRLKGVETSARLGTLPLTPDVSQQRSAIITEIQRLRAAGDSVAIIYPNNTLLVRGSVPGMGSIQRFIPRGTVVIEHIGDGDAIHIVALTRSQALVRTVSVPESTVRALAAEYVQLMLDPMVYRAEGGESSIPGMTRFATLSTQLYQTLLEPIEPLFERGILVVSSDLLGSLPVHALERQYPDGRLGFVVEQLSVDYLSTWTALMYPTRPATRLRSIVAFGNPTGKNWSVDYELRDIRSFFRNAEVFTGGDATWENMVRIKPDLLQVSSEFRSGLDLFGLFAVSEGGVSEQTKEMPFLSLVELDPPPVVLLTNQSGGGKELGPDQAHLLRMNGTSDVFLNRWVADRKATKFFSEFFFTHLSNGLAPGDAYRQALLNLIQTREHAHPRSWAQFFHYGTG